MKGCVININNFGTSDFNSKVNISKYPAPVVKWDYEQQIQVAVLNDEPTVDQIPLEVMNLYSLQTCLYVCVSCKKAAYA